MRAVLARIWATLFDTARKRAFNFTDTCSIESQSRLQRAECESSARVQWRLHLRLFARVRLSSTSTSPGRRIGASDCSSLARKVERASASDQRCDIGGQTQTARATARAAQRLRW